MRPLYHWWDSVLPEEVCDRLIQDCLQVPPQKGTTFNNDGSFTVNEHRNSTIRWVQRLPGISDLMWPYIWEATRQSFNIEISALFDIQFTEYNSTEEQYYKWHHDIDWTQDSGFDRKLSIIIQLTDPEDYTGGDLEFRLFNVPENMRNRGSILVFPSYLEHQVTPVTWGTRHSLVAWVEGPRWR